MKFKLARQIINQDLIPIVAREVKKQNLNPVRATKKNLQELADIGKVIENNELPDYLVRKKLPNNLGYGIFLHPQAKPLVKGRVIAPYTGEVSIVPQHAPDDSAYAFESLSTILLDKQEQELFDKNNRYHPKRHYSLKLDACKKGNFTRFINHSENPNVVAYLVTIPRNTQGLTPAPLEVVYFAKKTIQPGEQLLVCYEAGDKSYWGAFKIKPFVMTPQTYQLNPALQLVTSE